MLRFIWALFAGLVLVTNANAADGVRYKSNDAILDVGDVLRGNSSYIMTFLPLSDGSATKIDRNSRTAEYYTRMSPGFGDIKITVGSGEYSGFMSSLSVFNDTPFQCYFGLCSFCVPGIFCTGVLNDWAIYQGRLVGLDGDVLDVEARFYFSNSFLNSTDQITRFPPSVFGLPYAEVRLQRFNAANGSTETYISSLGQVPEPETWAMMILGFGLVGGAARLRKGITQTSMARQ